MQKHTNFVKKKCIDTTFADFRPSGEEGASGSPICCECRKHSSGISRL